MTSSVELEDNRSVQWNVSDNVPCNNALNVSDNVLCNNALRRPLEKERGLFIVVP